MDLILVLMIYRGRLSCREDKTRDFDINVYLYFKSIMSSTETNKDKEEGDNCYSVLGCPENVSQEALKKRYHELALMVSNLRQLHCIVFLKEIYNSIYHDFRCIRIDNKG